MRLRTITENKIYNVFIIEDNDRKPIVAVDVDGTLSSGPMTDKTIATPKKGAAKALKKFKDWGVTIVINTLNGDTQQVKDWLDEHDIPYDYINEDPPGKPDWASRKLAADVFIDDKAEDGNESWKKIVKHVRKRLKGKIGK